LFGARGGGTVPMIKVKQLKLRIFAQFVIIIAPIALVLIYQAVSDLRRTTAVESVVVRHGLSRATKDGFESFMTYAADAHCAARTRARRPSQQISRPWQARSR
jgi:hypothetical protein